MKSKVVQTFRIERKRHLGGGVANNHETLKLAFFSRRFVIENSLFFIFFTKFAPIVFNGGFDEKGCFLRVFRRKMSLVAMRKLFFSIFPKKKIIDIKVLLSSVKRNHVLHEGASCTYGFKKDRC